jgi:hypothetical protein
MRQKQIKSKNELLDLSNGEKVKLMHSFSKYTRIINDEAQKLVSISQSLRFLKEETGDMADHQEVLAFRAIETTRFRTKSLKLIY